MREIVQRSRGRLADLKGLPAPQRGDWPRALRGFDQRLHWHCHFIQKLESQPDLEFQELHPLTAGLRASEPERLAAWAAGRTGLPFVDACMRALIATGWINFRMRAMLMSVASYQLWLPWRDSGLVLARLFVDYEPGIHWSQCQMQSGTTGINTIRIYNPIKQGQDHDPQGLFLRQWLPELARVPVVHLHEPWTMPISTQASAGFALGIDYPLPLVDPAAAAREAKQRIWARRQEPGFRELAATVLQTHGSRRSGGTRSRPASKGGRRRSSTPKDGATRPLQLGLDLDLA
jgi:deoxyribodipyrimidine photo-lyase